MLGLREKHSRLFTSGFMLFIATLVFSKSSQATLPDHFPSLKQVKTYIAQRSLCLFAIGMTDGKRVMPDGVVCIMNGSTNSGGIYEKSGCLIGQLNLKTGRVTALNGDRDPTGGLKGGCSKKHIEKMLKTPIEKFVEPRMLDADGVPAFTYFWRMYEVHNRGVGVIYNPLNAKTPKVKVEE